MGERSRSSPVLLDVRYSNYCWHVVEDLDVRILCNIELIGRYLP